VSPRRKAVIMDNAKKSNVFISFSFDKSRKIKEKMEEKLEQSNYAVNYSEKVDRTDMTEETI
jgi:hypothetical protein